jgi:hypothetical protein
MKQAMIDYTKKDKHDLFDTPDYAIKPLLPYLPSYWTAWEPTDTTGKSRITKMLKQHGNKVISTGKKQIDFLTEQPSFNFDFIITNPPYSLKDAFIQRCIEYKKPWAMLMPLTALDGINRRKLFVQCNTELGLLVLDRRVEFTGGSVWFNTSWFCYKLLPKQLMFAELRKE